MAGSRILAHYISGSGSLEPLGRISRNAQYVLTMKHSHHHNNPPTEPQLVPVRFEFDNPAAVSVCVAGCFNHWNPSAKPMHRTTDGHWLKESALPAGRYEYRLVVDGAWMADPLAKESVANPFGGNNSVLNVTTPVAAPQTEPPRVSSKQTNNQKASKV